MLAWLFVHAGLDVLRNPAPRAAVAAPVIRAAREMVPGLPADDVTMVRLNAAAQLIAGGLLALGKWPMFAAFGLAVSLVPTTIGGHRFWEESDPARRMQHRTHFYKNLAIVGGLLFAALESQPR
jgi:uncharacterized membrane protein YphA (DoxX/SURF4 family)